MKVTPLREADATPLDGATVIDARFRVVGRKRSVLRSTWRVLKAIFFAALIGFLIPPAWVLIQEISAYFSGN